MKEYVPKICIIFESQLSRFVFFQVFSLDLCNDILRRMLSQKVKKSLKANISRQFQNSLITDAFLKKSGAKAEHLCLSYTKEFGPEIDLFDVFPEDYDNLFTSNDTENVLDLNADYEKELERTDNPLDCYLTAKLNGRKKRGLYETGWHAEKL